MKPKKRETSEKLEDEKKVQTYDNMEGEMSLNKKDSLEILVKIMHNNIRSVVETETNHSESFSINDVQLKKCVTVAYSGKHILVAYPPEREDSQYIVPDSVVELSEAAFTYCNNLERLLIQGNVSYINEGAIYGCKKLRYIYINEDNPCYISVDGVLYDKAMTTLLAYPSGKEDKLYKIPYGVRRIGKGAIAFSKHLEDLIVPETVVSAGEWFFEDTLLQIHCDDNSIVRKHFGENYPEHDMEMMREFNRKVAGR